MKEDVYGPQMRQIMEETSVPLSAADLQELVQASQARVYAWVKQNRTNLKALGRNNRGGTQYVWNTNPILQAARDRELAHLSNGSVGGTTIATPLDRVEIGQRYTLTAIRVEAGQVVLEWAHENGSSLSTTLRSALSI